MGVEPRTIMLTVSWTSHTATFHVTHKPRPLDPFYTSGPWMTWLRCDGVCSLDVSVNR